MAKQEHLDILKQGVEVWNQWRKKHPQIRPNLSYVVLIMEKLSEVDFRRTNLSQANFSGAKLPGANLSNAEILDKVHPRHEYAMFHDLRARYHWVLPTLCYQDNANLLTY